MIDDELFSVTNIRRKYNMRPRIPDDDDHISCGDRLRADLVMMGDRVLYFSFMVGKGLILGRLVEK